MKTIESIKRDGDCFLGAGIKEGSGLVRLGLKEIHGDIEFSTLYNGKDDGSIAEAWRPLKKIFSSFNSVSLVAHSTNDMHAVARNIKQAKPLVWGETTPFRNIFSSHDVAQDFLKTIDIDESLLFWCDLEELYQHFTNQELVINDVFSEAMGIATICEEMHLLSLSTEAPPNSSIAYFIHEHTPDHKHVAETYN